MYTYNGVVIKVVDGDTVDVNLDLGFDVHFIQRLRLNRIDTDELKDKDPIKRASANKAKDFLTETLLNKTVIIKTSKSDKYGRYLADVILNGQDISDLMLEKSLAHIYE